MDLFGALVANLGLLAFTIVTLALVGYLAYSLIRPEAF